LLYPPERSYQRFPLSRYTADGQRSREGIEESKNRRQNSLKPSILLFFDSPGEAKP
jgi:hypothetical protein